MIRVLVVDDHEIMRQGLSLLFELEEDFEVVEAGDGVEAVGKALESKPDVILMDIRMPRKNGIQASKEIKEKMPDAKIAALTAANDEEEIFRAIKSGIDSYILKNIGGEELVKAVRQVASGRSYLHPLIARKVMDRVASDKTIKTWSPQELTKRESMVLRLMAEGNKNKEIAAKLFVSEETVKSHVSNILMKLNQTDRMQAVLYALRHNLIMLDQDA